MKTFSVKGRFCTFFLMFCIGSLTSYETLEGLADVTDLQKIFKEADDTNHIQDKRMKKKVEEDQTDEWSSSKKFCWVSFDFNIVQLILLKCINS